MRMGIGGLSWRPADFWAATLTEFFEAIQGNNEAQGTGPDKKTDGPSADEMSALIAQYS